MGTRPIVQPRAGASFVRAALGAPAAGLMLALMGAPAMAGALDAMPSAPAAATRGAVNDAVHDPARDAARWDLPRIFYDARQRRSLDAQDRAIRMGQAAAGAGPSGPRFDGWESGPSGTHAWVNGTRYVADGSGRLHAADDHGAPRADTLEDGAARLDRTRGVLVVRRETDAALRLRVGETDNPADPAAVPPGAPDPRP